MKISQLIKEIKGTFKLPVKKYYIGKIFHGTPYFLPIGYNSTIISFRKLEEKSKEQLEEFYKQYPHLVNRPEHKFKNMPMVRRSKDWIFKLFGNYYWLQVGWPISICRNELGWKDKWNEPRYEWCPAFYIFFFKWQFVIHWVAPYDGNNDAYYEMILRYLKYENKDIVQTENNWGWINSETKESTWNKNCIV